jgi:putative membrane protein
MTRGAIGEARGARRARCGQSRSDVPGARCEARGARCEVRGPKAKALALVAIILLASNRLGAHGILEAGAWRWTWEPYVLVPITISVLLYAIGVGRLWKRAGRGHGLAYGHVASFAAGTLTIVVALLSPVAWISQILFSVHMTQHTLLMLVAAPLLTFGHPIFAWLWAFGHRRREAIARAARQRQVAGTWRQLTAPLTVFILQAAALWLWHIPSWYQAALANDGVHALQHLCFVLSASLFWWAMVNGRYGPAGYGLAVLYVFLTAVHSSALGALLTVSPSLWYGDYAQQAQVWHVNALADQQLAGLLMWIPASVIFIVFGLALFAAWLGESEKRVAFGAADASAHGVLKARPPHVR